MTLLPSLALRAWASEATCSPERGAAEVTSAVTSPRALAASSRKATMIASSANRRPFLAISLRKFATNGLVFALASSASSALALSSLVMTGERRKRAKSALSPMRRETSESDVSTDAS
ncbi:hypothetical protein FQZ97_1124300 [compost metagenome]